MKWTWRDTLSVSIITLVVSAFFFRLFWPTPQLIVTPDFGLSDAWNSGFAVRYALSQSLTQGKLPLWSHIIGDGFPLYALGESGTFFLPNILLFSLLDAVTAYNLALAISALTAAIGLYVWIRTLGLPRTIGCAAGVTLGLSGIIIAPLSHLTLLQSFTLMPLLMAATHLLALRPTWRRGALLSLLFGQQILTGFPQGVFITLCFSVPYILVLTWGKNWQFRATVTFAAASVFALFLGAVQLLPSFEFMGQLVDPEGFSLFSASRYAFPIRHLLTFVNPFALGNPKLGTYLSGGDGSIFWENSGYIGVIPLLCMPFAFFAKKRRKIIVFFILTALAALLLMLGRNSPFYILYSFWPFTMFRVPSRFIWIFVLSLLILFALGLSHVIRSLQSTILRYLLVSALIAAQWYMLSSVWRSYHHLESAAGLLYADSVLTTIGGVTKTYGLNLMNSYSDHFIKRGWTDMRFYDLLQTTLIPNVNLITGIPSHEVYAGRTLRRGALLDAMLANELQLGTEEATVSANGHKLFDSMGITTVLSLTRVHDPKLQLTKTATDAALTLYVYTNPTAVPRTYLSSSVVAATTAQEAQRHMFADSFLPGQTVLLERALVVSQTETNGEARITESSDTRVVIRVTNHPNENMLVLQDTYYPGWKGTIDGKETPIYPANIKYRAVVVPAGNHTVVFSYQPAAFATGASISSISWIAIICLAAFLLVSEVYQKHPEAFWRARRPRRSRDT